jgi:hypothetical protein
MRIDLDTETADSIRVKRSSGSKKKIVGSIKFTRYQFHYNP